MGMNAAPKTAPDASLSPDLTSVRGTTPWHIWHHHLRCAAHGVPSEVWDAQRERIARWYAAGEPVWMAADSLRQFARGARIAAMESADRDVIRSAWRSAVEASR